MRRLLLLTLVLLAAAPVASARAGAPSPPLRAGAGQADITPPQTGYFLGGWTRADRVATGQSTRLFSNALVLESGGRKVALVAAELFAIPAGLQEDVARALADRGFDPTNVLLAASHTHSGPGGFANNPTYNTAAPSVQTVTDPLSFVRLLDPAPADRQLYTFLVTQIAQSIRRADDDLAPAAAGWARTELHGLTQNRSIEAHLADHGIHVAYGQGDARMDPDGAEHTIDPSVDVLRVDHVMRRQGRTVGVPIGAWSNFADHGTVVHSETEAYSGDHHAAAWRVFAQLVRRAGRVPPGQPVVNVYPNSDEGDQTAGIVHVGMAAAAYVGTREGQAMFRAWKAAGPRLSRSPALDIRWTRTCFCGLDTATGPVAKKGAVGIGFLTGSEEGRGPLYDVTHVPLEGVTSPLALGEQGNKVVVPGAGDPPPAVPIAVVRIGDGALASVPGEPTKEAGARMKAAVLDAMAPGGVTQVVIAGLALDYIQYVSTPEEYGQQSYEGASTLFGPNEGTFIAEQLADLGRRLVAGAPAPAPYPLDSSYGVHADGPAYPPGAAAGSITEEPAPAVARLGHAVLRWQGGPSGRDRPVDAPFVRAERRVGGRWVAYDDDLGLNMLWRTDDQGRYKATWEVPYLAPAGAYRLTVTATRYRLSSRPFSVAPVALGVAQAPAAPGRVAVRLTYPAAVADRDLADRPAAASGGVVRFRIGERTVTVRRRSGATFSVPAPAGTPLTIPAGAGHDRYANATGAAVTLTPGG